MQEIRRTQLRSLLHQRFDGKQAALAEAVDRSASQVSALFSGQRAIGEKLARDFERHLNLSVGWLDTPVEQGAAKNTGHAKPATVQVADASATIDWNLLEVIIEATDRLIAEERRPMRPELRTRLIKAMYEYYADQEESLAEADRAKIFDIVKAAWAAGTGAHDAGTKTPQGSGSAQ